MKKTLQERITEHPTDNTYSVTRVQLDNLLEKATREETVFS